MEWTDELEPGENVCWEGRPAPRCFTFRNWKHSLFGVLLLLLASYWQWVGIGLSAAYDLRFLAWIPLPFLLLGLYLALGHLLLARLEWPRTGYLLTDRRLMARRGLLRPRLEQLPLAEMTYFCLQPLGRELGSLRVEGERGHLALPCLEHPHLLTDRLETVLVRNGHCAAPSGARSPEEPSAGGSV